MQSPAGGPATTVIQLALDLSVRPGNGDALRPLIGELVESARSEKGTLRYEWSISDDGERCHVLEEYADMNALMAHLATFGERFANRVMEVLEPTTTVICGHIPPAARAHFAMMHPTFMTPLSGFQRPLTTAESAL